MNNKPIILIDGSSLAFLHGNKENYTETIRDHIKGLCNKYNTSYYVIVLEQSSTNFRIKLAVSHEYKGQRRTEKSKTNIKNYLPYLNECFKEIKNKYKPVTYLNIENDDAIAILANRLGNVIIAGNDKDLLCIEGEHHNLKTNKKCTVKLPGTIEMVNGKVKSTGLYNVYFKLLKGSQKENYKGLEGYGDKKVYDVLKDLSTEDELQQISIDLFKQVYPDNYKEKIEEGFRLCWIIQYNDNLITPIINTI